MISDKPTTTIQGTSENGLSVFQISLASRTEYYVTLTPTRNDEPAEVQAEGLYRRLAEWMQANEAQLLYERIYAETEAWEGLMEVRERMFKEVSHFDGGPAALFDGGPCEGRGISGLQVWAVSGTPVRSIEHEGRVCGRSFRGEEGEYAILSALHAEPGENRLAHAYRMFEEAAVLLQQSGFSYKTDILRTWIYLEDILAWYDEFNRARSTVYRKIGVMSSEGFLPASTGIGFRVPGGVHCVMDVLAFRRNPKATTTIRRCRNPLQNEAPEYGSAFTRGTEVTVGPMRLALVSGTASIDEAGQTVHQGDPHKQMVRTIENIRALLRQSRMAWQDIVQGTVFLPSPELRDIFRQVYEQLNLPEVPLLQVRGTVCREDLLVEIEVAAVKPFSLSPGH